MVRRVRPTLPAAECSACTTSIGTNECREHLGLSSSARTQRWHAARRPPPEGAMTGREYCAILTVDANGDIGVTFPAPPPVEPRRPVPAAFETALRSARVEPEAEAAERDKRVLLAAVLQRGSGKKPQFEFGFVTTSEPNAKADAPLWRHSPRAPPSQGGRPRGLSSSRRQLSRPCCVCSAGWRGPSGPGGRRARRTTARAF